MSELNEHLSRENENKNKEKTEITHYSNVIRQNVNFSVENAPSTPSINLNDYLQSLEKVVPNNNQSKKRFKTKA